MSDQIPVCCFRSQKGGVGKTTLALSVAAEYAEDGLVVVIDADVLGTELADLIFPDDQPDFWRLSLVELMTVSVGGNQTFDAWLDKAIGDEPTDGLPWVNLRNDDDEIVVLPSLAPTSAKDRGEALLGLDSQFLVLDFAREQLARRLVWLLLAIVKKWKPAAIVIDNSPLLAGLGSLLAELPDRSPVGAEKEHKLLFGGKTRAVDWYDLEVIGPDLQDLKTFFANYKKLKDEPCSEGFWRGWILNKHPHFPPVPYDVTAALVRAYFCPAVAAAKETALIGELVKDDRVLHCNLSPILAFGQSARYIERDSEKSMLYLRLPPGDELRADDGIRPNLAAEKVTDMLAASLGSLVKSRGDSNRQEYVPVELWADWLRKLPPGTP